MTQLDGRLHCRFEWDGQTIDYHGQGGYYEYKQVKTYAGLSMLQLPHALSRGDVDAVLAMVWLGLRMRGETVEWPELAVRLVDPQAVLASVVPLNTAPDDETPPGEPVKELGEGPADVT